MKTNLENGARPVTALGQLDQSRAGRLVDWARSFSSLTTRKSHNGLRYKCSDPDSRLCQELMRFLDCTRLEKRLSTHQKQTNQKSIERGRSATHPLHPGEQDLRARLSSLPFLSPLVRLKGNEKMKD
jgi:hypothetical protein